MAIIIVFLILIVAPLLIKGMFAKPDRKPDTFLKRIAKLVFFLTLGYLGYLGYLMYDDYSRKPDIHCSRRGCG